MTLKPCPFCGSADISTDDDDEYMTCDKCVATGPSTKTREESWNSRPREDALVAMLRSLEWTQTAFKGVRACPVCLQTEKPVKDWHGPGHSPSCQLAALLRDAP